jgi:hypothetical protein
MAEAAELVEITGSPLEEIAFCLSRRSVTEAKSDP